MSNHEPSMMDLLIETHIGLERQGPGSPEMIDRALSFLEPLDRFSRVADLGCGTGGQTLQLAERLPGQITGLDLFPVFVDALNQKARDRRLDGRVTGVVGHMEDLPFEKASLDLIWSEGAIDNIGFEAGLTHWRVFLKPGGCVAVTCPSWFTDEHPAAVQEFWTQAGSGLDSVDHNVALMQACGFAFVAAFALPESCWIDGYYDPREAAIQKLLNKYPQSDVMREYARLNRQEVALYREYKRHYGYVFYIGRLSESL